MQTFTFSGSAAESVASQSTVLEVAGSYDQRYKNRVAYFGATGDVGTGAAATVVAYLVERDGNSGVGRIVAKQTATITPTARRDNLANAASGDYLATVSWDVSSSNTIDLSAAQGQSGKFEWRLACTAKGGFSTINLFVLGFDSEV